LCLKQFEIFKGYSHFPILSTIALKYLTPKSLLGNMNYIHYLLKYDEKY